MAEAIGAAASVVTLLGVLTNCIEAFDLIRAAKDQQKDLEKLDLKLALEQCRLMIWGKSMGLIQEDENQRRNLLDHFEFRTIVQQALQHIVDVLTDSNHLSKKYGGRQITIEQISNLTIEYGPSSSVNGLVAAFDRFKLNETIRDKASKVKRTSVWVFQDRKKFERLIGEVREMVDTVEKLTKDLVSQAQQEQIMVSRINTISNVKTLNMITEVCEVDHPTYSDAASTRAEIVSMTTTHRADIFSWIREADKAEDPSREIEEIESWDWNELRTRYLQLKSLPDMPARPPSAVNAGVSREGDSTRLPSHEKSLELRQHPPLADVNDGRENNRVQQYKSGIHTKIPHGSNTDSDNQSSAFALVGSSDAKTATVQQIPIPTLIAYFRRRLTVEQEQRAYKIMLKVDATKFICGHDDDSDAQSNNETQDFSVSTDFGQLNTTESLDTDDSRPNQSCTAGIDPEDFFRALNAKWRCRWEGSTIVVQEMFMIDEPYRPRNVLFYGDRRGNLQLLRQVVAFERDRLERQQALEGTRRLKWEEFERAIEQGSNEYEYAVEFARQQG